MPPEPSDVERIGDLLAALYDIYTPEGVGIWLRGKNANLGGATPIGLLRENEYRAVEREVRALTDGMVAS